MHWTTDALLATLDRCCDSFTFPMLDNGYLYLAATRLSVHHSVDDWAVVIETFGFSPRSGVPDIHVQTYSSNLHDRDPVESYVTREAHAKYLQANPHNESRFFQPFDDDVWQDPDNLESVLPDVREIILRGRSLPPPAAPDYVAAGVSLEDPPNPLVFELCRAYAHLYRDAVLATQSERRASLPPGMTQLMQLEDWHHPDVVADELPSRSETFQMLAKVAISGDVTLYRPTLAPNTHWRNWPDGGTL